MTITEDLATISTIMLFIMNKIVDMAQAFMQWPLVLVPGLVITLIIIKKVKSTIGVDSRTQRYNKSEQRLKEEGRYDLLD